MSIESSIFNKDRPTETKKWLKKINNKTRKEITWS